VLLIGNHEDFLTGSYLDNDTKMRETWFDDRNRGRIFYDQVRAKVAKNSLTEKISEADFLNAIKFLIENKIIVLDTVIAVEGGTLVKEDVPHATTSHVVIPNGNSDVANTASYIPLNLEIKKGTTVIWINDDVVKHTVQSQDGHGKIVSLFNSDVLDSGNRFAHKFEESGVYNYYCTIHPWRVGLVTVR